MSSPTSQLTHTLVRAGAGAGKTRGLVEKVVEVYRQGQLPGGREPRIVLTTFTRKATQELKERLIRRACEEQDAPMLRYVSDPNRLQISTIHGLLNLFLRQVGHLADMDAGFQIVNEGEGQKLARLALREVLVNDSNSLRWLETYGFGRILEMCRQFHFRSRTDGGLSPARVADLEAIRSVEMEKWKTRLLSLADSVMTHALDAGWTKFSLGLKEFIARWNGNSIEEFPRPPRRSSRTDSETLRTEVEEVVDDFKKSMGKPCWDQERWTAMAEEWESFLSLSTDFSTRLMELKENLAQFEMLDIEIKALEILRAKPFLASVFAEAWDFWMIDEYQDTSPLQVSILDALIGERPRYLVGDPQQSIYLFRGAEVEVFREAELRTSRTNGQIVELKNNYRSRPELLYWINDFMASYGGGFTQMEPQAASAIRDTSCVTLWRAPNPDAELIGIVARVEQLLAGGARLDDICILGRTHRHLMDVSGALKNYGYPTHVHAARGFSGRREVVDVQVLWKFLINPHDNLNLLVLLRSPWFLVADWQLAEWMKERPPSLWRKLNSLSDVPNGIERLRASLKQLPELGIVQTFKQALCDNLILDLSLENDPAGRKESNIWKMIDNADQIEKESGLSILQLTDLTQDTEGSEGDATSAQEPNCINLMTIHGSKGLEFGHVIVPRVGESPRASATPPFNSDQGKFFFPVWSEPEGEFIASPLDVMTNLKQREKERQEFDRWLYVAVTRARESLTLSWSDMERDSWAARGAFFTAPVGEHAHKNYKFCLVEEWPEPKRFVKSASEQIEIPPLYNRVSDPLLSRASVTALVEQKTSTPDDQILYRWQRQNSGIRLHQAMESLKYFDPPADDPALSFVFDLNDPPLRDLIRLGHTEWSFQVQTPRQIVEGQIDLWGKHNGVLYIIDYKSGSAQYEAAALAQLSLYAWALRKFGHLEPIVMVVVYPLDKKVTRRDFPADLFFSWEQKFGSAEATR